MKYLNKIIQSLCFKNLIFLKISQFSYKNIAYNVCLTYTINYVLAYNIKHINNHNYTKNLYKLKLKV